MGTAGGKDGTVISNSLITAGLTGKVTINQGLEEGREKSVLSRGKSQCKG